MALQPKSSNLPEMQAEPVVSAATPNLIPGSENALGCQEKQGENLKSAEQRAEAAAAAEGTPQRETQAPKKESKPVLGQQQQGKPSRTDVINCPDIIEEKVKPVNPEDHDKPRKTITYQRGRFLGKGGFAKCYEVSRIEPIETEEQKSMTWALKVVPKANLTRTKARQKLTSEIKIHRSLDHEHVARFDRYFEDKENVYIMLDICSNQSLSDMIKRRKRLHEVEARYYIYQLVKGIEYVHSRKVIHRDLKLGNLFLDENMQLKVGDFGLAAQVFYQGEKKRTVCGTPNYLAPEVLEQNGGHSYEVDYWSIGVILYTMLNGRPPFESQEVKHTYKKIRAGAFSFPEHIQFGSYSKDFIRKCLTVDITKRANIQDMLQHDFLCLVPIPKQIPVSTLVCPPAQAFARQYSLPVKSSMANADMSPSPMGTNPAIRQKRILHHMQTAPMENALRQIKTQKSLEGHPQNNMKGALYSPLANGLDNGNSDNAHILGSEKTAGLTPVQPNIMRQVSNGPVICSEFNPMNVGEENREKALDNPQIKTSEYNNLQKVLVDNFLKTQNVLNLAPNSGMKSMPSSPGAAGTFGRQQANLGGTLSMNKKNRRLTSSVSATNIPQLQRQNVPTSGYNTNTNAAQQQPIANMLAPTPTDQTCAKQPSSELAKIQPTSAATIDHDTLIQKSEGQQRTELVVKFVDFSSKYGLGYMLSNGSYGVLFNDSTKIILHPNQFHFDYVERSKAQPVVNGQGQAAESVTDQISSFDFFNYPESINKKVVLLQHFKSYLDGNQKFKPLEFSFTKENAPVRTPVDENNGNLVYIKKWKRAKKAILLRNTNKVIQVMFQDQSELILCSGSGYVTFVNSKQEVKGMPLSVGDDLNLETTDKSLYKRLQYAKEILVQMISVQSMPSTLALNNQAVNFEEQEEAKPNGNYATQAMRASVDLVKSASKIPTMMMSPFNSKSNQKGKEHARTYRMGQTLTASKAQTHTTTNLLSSNAKQATKNRIELPMLSNRSNSKPNFVQKNLAKESSARMTQASGSQLTQSHNLLPSKIGTGIMSQTAKTSSLARLYQSGTETAGAGTSGSRAGSIGLNNQGTNAPKVSSQKSPGKTFKHRSNAQSASQMTTLVGSGVRKQQFAASQKM